MTSRLVVRVRCLMSLTNCLDNGDDDDVDDDDDDDNDDDDDWDLER